MRVDRSPQDEPLTYSRVAAVALPPMFIAVLYLLYRDFDHLANSGGPATPVVAEPASKPAVAANPSSRSAAEVFGGIYRDQLWGVNDAGEGTSGTGSTVEATSLYRAYLQTFMKEHDIKSVVDAGCGDWEFSRTMDWTGIEYKGFDVVASVIASNTKKFTSANVHFAVANILTDELPPADLIISKHVLQHLPNADVKRFLARLGQYRHALLTDGVNPRSLSSDNPDIPIGAFRYLDPTQPPFSLEGRKALTWWDGLHMQQVVHLERRASKDASR